MNNSGASGCAIFATRRAELHLYSTTVRGGLRSGITLIGSKLLGAHVSLSDNSGMGLSMLDGVAYLENSYLTRNGSRAASALGASTLYLRHCEVRSNGGPMQCDPECAVRFRKCTGDAEAERVFAQYKVSVEKGGAKAGGGLSPRPVKITPSV